LVGSADRCGVISQEAARLTGLKAGTPVAGDIMIDYKKGTLSVNGLNLNEGDFISLDGFTGEVFGEKIPVKPSEIVQVLNGSMKREDSLLYQDYEKFMGYVDEIRTMQVRTNADTPTDAQMAVALGAEGIGLCRTEHMFFGGQRIISVRKMILANNTIEREKALNELLPMQRVDFEEIFTAMNGMPVTVRLLDPPLHEFLPNDHTSRHEMALQLRVSVEEIAHKTAQLHEFNPMLGFRGCRLAIVYPEILKMQVRAIIEAALNVKAKGIKVRPEIMIPLVGHYKEFEFTKRHAIATIEEVFAEKGSKVDYSIGTMIEVPRAAVTADEIAKSAEFFSFGTNDLTQMGCGFSRDDSASFLGPYVNDIDKQFYHYDPFETIDIDGVGKMVKMAVDLGRSARKDLKLGICGEHGGDPKSIAFFNSVGLDYVSCSPFRVPVARLSAAQAALEQK
jgi:pyruvate,orthophosphate dikinase